MRRAGLIAIVLVITACPTEAEEFWVSCPKHLGDGTPTDFFGRHGPFGSESEATAFRDDNCPHGNVQLGEQIVRASDAKVGARRG